MRAVAASLKVTPMALYHHVQNKAGLVALLADATIKKYPLPPPTGIWQDDLWAMARWMWETKLAHPVVAHLRRAYQVWTPDMLHMTEHWLSLWRQSGLAMDQAVIAATTSSMAIIGLVEEELVLAEMKHPGKETLAWLPNARLVFERKRNREAEFELVVRSLIEGLHARLMRPASRRARMSSNRRS